MTFLRLWSNPPFNRTHSGLVPVDPSWVLKEDAGPGSSGPDPNPDPEPAAGLRQVRTPPLFVRVQEITGSDVPPLRNAFALSVPERITASAESNVCLEKRFSCKLMSPEQHVLTVPPCSPPENT